MFKRIHNHIHNGTRCNELMGRVGAGFVNKANEQGEGKGKGVRVGKRIWGVSYVQKQVHIIHGT